MGCGETIRGMSYVACKKGGDMARVINNKDKREMVIEEYIRTKIAEIRLRKNLSERRLSKLLGYNPTYTTQISNGSTAPSF